MVLISTDISMFRLKKGRARDICIDFSSGSVGQGRWTYNYRVIWSWRANMFTEQPQRPAMRRKSSAQNFLSSFKSTSSSGSITSQSLNPTASLASNATNLPYSTTSPTTTPQTREWDSQSLHSDTVGSSMAGAQSPSLAPGTSVDYLRDLVQKRIITLTYIRQIHEGWVTRDNLTHPNCLC